MRWARTALLAWAAGLAVGVAAASAQVPEYRLKAEFVERFTRFIEWPGESAGRTFVIGVFGRNPFGSHLENLAASRTVRGRPIEVRLVRDLDGIDACQVLFIPRAEAAQLRDVLRHTGGRPVLTVGDTDGFAEAGVIINFYEAGDSLRFEINERAAHSSGLRIGSQVLRLARLVDAEDRR